MSWVRAIIIHISQTRKQVQWARKQKSWDSRSGVQLQGLISKWLHIASWWKHVTQNTAQGLWHGCALQSSHAQNSSWYTRHSQCWLAISLGRQSVVDCSFCKCIAAASVCFVQWVEPLACLVSTKVASQNKDLGRFLQRTMFEGRTWLQTQERSKKRKGLILHLFVIWALHLLQNKHSRNWLEVRTQFKKI